LPALRALTIAFTLLAAFMFGAARADPAPIAPKAQWIVAQLDKLGVVSKWPAGVHVNWRTGVPDGKPVSAEGRHTHCSAFVASAAQTLGVYILRPPRHGQILLANAQYEWLAGDGAAEGWRPVSGFAEAQDAANRGSLVVAAYHSHRGNKPGHIAIVLPGEKSETMLEAEGPNVIMAGIINSASIDLKDGFAGHPRAWADKEVKFYAHEVVEP
jgi:hypothetical protein